MEKTKEKIPRYTIQFSKEENDALDIISSIPLFQELDISRRKMIKYAITTTAKSIASAEAPLTKSDLIEIMSGMAQGGKTKSMLAPVAQRATKTEVEDKRKEAGALICDSLGGVSDGNSCVYTKYEVSAAGRAISYSITDPLAALSEADIAKQFDPSKEAWDQAKLSDAG